MAYLSLGFSGNGDAEEQEPVEATSTVSLPTGMVLRLAAGTVVWDSERNTGELISDVEVAVTEDALGIPESASSGRIVGTAASVGDPSKPTQPVPVESLSAFGARLSSGYEGHFPARSRIFLPAGIFYTIVSAIAGYDLPTGDGTSSSLLIGAGILALVVGGVVIYKMTK